MRNKDKIINRVVMVMCKLHNIFIYDVDEFECENDVYKFSSSIFNFELHYIDDSYVYVCVYNKNGMLKYTLNFEVDHYKDDFLVMENSMRKHIQGYKDTYMEYINTGVSIIKTYYKNNETVYTMTKKIDDIYSL